LPNWRISSYLAYDALTKARTRSFNT
jgi:hypothetical protein